MVFAKGRGPLEDPVRSKTILVVDDDEDFRDAIVELLAAAGYEVGWASNGEDALNEIRKGGRPDLILLDMHMPVMTGAEFLDTRARDKQLQRVPVVVMSGQPVVFTRAAYGVVDVIVKPFSFDALLSIAKRHTGLGVTH